MSSAGKIVLRASVVPGKVKEQQAVAVVKILILVAAHHIVEELGKLKGKLHRRKLPAVRRGRRGRRRVHEHMPAAPAAANMTPIAHVMFVTTVFQAEPLRRSVAEVRLELIIRIA